MRSAHHDQLGHFAPSRLAKMPTSGVGERVSMWRIVNLERCNFTSWVPSPNEELRYIVRKGFAWFLHQTKSKCSKKQHFFANIDYFGCFYIFKHLSAAVCPGWPRIGVAADPCPAVPLPTFAAAVVVISTTTIDLFQKYGPLFVMTRINSRHKTTM